MPSGPRKIALTVPPTASLPYSTLDGPLTTSRRSTTAGSIAHQYWLGPERIVELFSRMPSTSMSVWKPVRPRT